MKPKKMEYQSELEEILDSLDTKDRQKIVDRVVEYMTRPQIVEDLWEKPDLAFTNWILIISGINQNDESSIAKVLFFWKGVFAKNSAQVSCVQSSDRRAFKCCLSHFGNFSCPTLILGDSPTMDNYIQIESELLVRLIKEDGSFQRFLTTIHSSIENGKTLKDIAKELKTEKWWSRLKMAYGEVKDLLSFKVSTNID